MLIVTLKYKLLFNFFLLFNLFQKKGPTFIVLELLSKTPLKNI